MPRSNFRNTAQNLINIFLLLLIPYFLSPIPFTLHIQDLSLPEMRLHYILFVGICVDRSLYKHKTMDQLESNSGAIWFKLGFIPQHSQKLMVWSLLKSLIYKNLPLTTQFVPSLDHSHCQKVTALHTMIRISLILCLALILLPRAKQVK